MSNGRIKDFQLTASSSYDEHHQPFHARLNKTVKGSRGGWCSAFADETEFLEVNLGNKTTVSGKVLGALLHINILVTGLLNSMNVK